MRRVLKVALATVATIPLGLVTAGPAMALNCGSGYACIYANQGFNTNGNTAAYVRFGSYIPDYSRWTYNGTSINANNTASSVSNSGTQKTACFYDGTGGTGAVFCLAKGTGDQDLGDSSGNVVGGWNNRISSGYFR